METYCDRLFMTSSSGVSAPEGTEFTEGTTLPRAICEAALLAFVRAVKKENTDGA